MQLNIETFHNVVLQPKPQLCAMPKRRYREQNEQSLMQKLIQDAPLMQRITEKPEPLEVRSEPCARQPSAATFRIVRRTS